VHIYILGPKLLRWNFFKTLTVSPIYTKWTKWCAQTFPAIFRLFVIFDGNFAKIVAQSGDVNENHVVHLTEQSLLKKSLKMISKSTHKPSHNICLNYVPHAQADQKSVTYKKHQFSLLQQARVVRSPQTLHADRERRDNSKR